LVVSLLFFSKQIRFGYISNVIFLFIILIFQGCNPEKKSPPESDSPVLLDYGPKYGGDFVLIDHNEEQFDLLSYRGDVVLIFFGYTYCPDACPLMLSKLAAVYDDLLNINAGGNVRTLYITVDPLRDTPKQLKLYLEYFSSLEVLGLTGSREEIDDVVEKYGVFYKFQEANQNGHYLVAHTTSLFLVDREGRLRYRFHPTDKPEYITAGIHQLF